VISKLNNEQLLLWLSGKLPGREAQYRMAPADRDPMNPPANPKEAAVLLLIYQDADRQRLVLMKRNVYDGPHSGQISFPGGMREAEDLDTEQTAIRETAEETGIDTGGISILGKLTPLYIPVSNFLVQPFIGWYSKVPVFSPDKSEVQYLLTPDIMELTDPSCRSVDSFFIRGKEIEIPCFSYKNEIIWGATAMILSEFMALCGYWPLPQHQ